MSIPCVGTGAFGLTAADSAQVTFQALSSLRGSCRNLRNVRVVVFQAQMFQEFWLAQERQATQDMGKQESNSTAGEAIVNVARETRNTATNPNSTSECSLIIYVTGKDKGSVIKAIDDLKKGFSEACETQKVKNETVSKLSPEQIDGLRRISKDWDVELEMEDDTDCIVVRGDPVEVQRMVGEIQQEIYERNKKIQEKDQAMMLLNNIEWSYEIHGERNKNGERMVFSPTTNLELEMASTKKQPTVQISLRGDDFVIDLTAKTGHGKRYGETITLSRNVKEGQCKLNGFKIISLNRVVHSAMLAN